MSTTQTDPPQPANRANSGTEDHRSEFSALTAQTPVDKGFRAAFLKSKLRLAHTHPALDVASRDARVEGVAEGLGQDASTVLMQPIPGGVGYGLFYNQPFKTGWGQGTSLAWDIVAPTPPAGNVSTWLYLTGMNRAALGVEAFVSYDGQGDTHFRVFDWSRTDHWQTDIPLSGLSDYLRTESAHGHPFQVISVWNTTSQQNAGTWRNEVLLYNNTRGGWDLVYRYDYAASDAQQKAAFVGSWTAIVETFQALYAKTSPMGALGIQISAADASGKWGSWALVTASDSYLRADNVGFSSVFIDPNYAFIVVS